MKQKTVNRRNRLEGQIETLAKSSPEAALEMATFGKVRSELEKAVWQYLFAREVCRDQNLYRDVDASGQERARCLRQSAEELSRLFLDAVDNRDNAALLLIAKEVKRFQRYATEHEPRRATILLFKSILEKHGETMTRRQLAGSDANVEAMSKIAKRLKFPFISDTIGRPKGATNKLKR